MMALMSLGGLGLKSFSSEDVITEVNEVGFYFISYTPHTKISVHGDFVENVTKFRHGCHANIINCITFKSKLCENFKQRFKTR